MGFTEWETPQEFYDAMNKEFGFSLDVCSLKETAKCEEYYTPSENGLSQDWHGTCWMNPPYDRTIGQWMEKAYTSAQGGATIVCLIPGRSSDTSWWHEYAMRSSEIRYIKSRLNFAKNGVTQNNCNISNVVVVFLPFCVGPPKVSAIDIKGRHLTKH